MPSPANNQPNNTNNAQQNQQETFDSSAYIQKDVFDVQIDGIIKRIEKVEARTGDKAAMVTTLEETFTDRNIDTVMNDYIEKHIDLQPLVQKAVDAMDKRLFKAFMKKTGIWVLGVVWSLILVAATTWVNQTVQNSSKPPETNKTTNR